MSMSNGEYMDYLELVIHSIKTALDHNDYTAAKKIATDELVAIEEGNRAYREVTEQGD